jgi:hypothetical protein
LLPSDDPPGGGGEEANRERDHLDVLDDLGGVVPHVAPNGPQDAADQFDLDLVVALGMRHQPAAPPQFEQRGADLMAHARLAKERKRTRAAEELAAKRMEEQTLQLQKVRSAFPAVARACDLPVPALAKRPRTSDVDERMSDIRSVALIKASFEKAVPRGPGVTHERLVAFSAKLVLDLQRDGLIEFLLKCAAIRACPPTGSVNVVLLAYSHESDATSQSVGQQQIQRIGRASKQRLATEILQQRGAIHACLMQLCRRSGTVQAETWIHNEWQAESLVMLGKSAPFVLECLHRGMPFDLGGSAWPQYVKALESSCDVIIVDQTTDKGSNNIPALKHIACELSECPRALADISCCEIHVVQNLKNIVPQVKPLVGRLFSLSKVYKTASFHDELINSIAWLCDRVHRVVGEPPAGAHDDVKCLADALYDLRASYHERAAPGQVSFLIRDVLELSALPLFEQAGHHVNHQGISRAHYCWNSSTGKPCCSSDDEFHERLTVAVVNFHASAAFDQVSMNRFTHVAKARKRLIMGMTSQRLFISAAAFAAKRSVNPDAPGVPDIPRMDVSPEELGAEQGHLLLSHQTRCGKLRQWFSPRQF